YFHVTGVQTCALPIFAVAVVVVNRLAAAPHLVLTLAAVVEEGLADASTVYSVPDHIRRSGETIHDYYSHGEDQMTLAGIMAKSRQRKSVGEGKRRRSR